jgi:hypothetical protein
MSSKYVDERRILNLTLNNDMANRKGYLLPISIKWKNAEIKKVKIEVKIIPWNSLIEGFRAFEIHKGS